MRMLLVEDDRRLSDAVVEILKDHGYEVDAAYDGDTGLSWLRMGIYDFAILDVMVPGADGFSIVKAIRAEGSRIPVLMLTAKSQLDDKLEGLDGGADDYMTKPFAPAELLGRIRSLCRRAGIGEEAPVTELEFAGLSLNLDNHELSFGGKSISISLKEFQIAKMLLENTGHVTSKEQIMKAVWGDDATDNNVEAYISLLRKKLKFLKATVAIDTIRKVGYRLVVVE